MAYLLTPTAALSELSEWRPDVNWVYALGEIGGTAIKFGKAGKSLRGRIDSVNRDQMTDDRYVLLAAVRGTPNDEAVIHNHFSEWRIDKGSRKEYYRAVPEVVEYVSWLRRGFWATTDPDADDEVAVDPAHWLPTPERRAAPPTADDSRLVQDWDSQPGPLAGTAWSWMPNPKASFQDYFTPHEIIEAARVAMGGIDLDAASHWAANKVHRIPDYFDVNRSAFDNDWHGAVWLNPPYGNNAPWFERVQQVMDSGAVSQLCMLSPVWVFNTSIAATLMERVAGMVLLTPTPKFWGNAEGRTGTNNPHAIVYIGPRSAEFFQAFAPFGIPFQLVTDKAVSDAA